MVENRVIVPGSERRGMAGSHVVGAPDPEHLIEVTVLVRSRAGTPDPHGAAPEQHISREQFEQQFGADPQDVEKVEDFAGHHDLAVVSADLARKSIVLSGTVGAMMQAFGVKLENVKHDSGTFRTRQGPVYVPKELDGIVTGVFGLDDRPQARTRFRRYETHTGPRAAGDTSYTPIDVAKLYNFPMNSNGAGQTIAIIELGGAFRGSELNRYFTSLGIRTPPKVVAVSVDGAKNKPSNNPNGPDGEVLLDIEITGAICPGAKIAVYFAPNTDRGFLDAITTAVHDKLRKPSVISISWGGAESTWTSQSLTAYNQAFSDAATLGVTVCCASGDDGSADGVKDGMAHVDFPAASPFALACGGTRLIANGTAIQDEVVWNHGPGLGASGGGVSEVFPLPAYQANAGVPLSVNPTHFKGRGVPDISGDADPGTGYKILVDGTNAVYGGTSAVAPLWAALITLINQQRKTPVGFLHPRIYGSLSQAGALRDIVTGDNGAYQAGPGWDACTGMGSPNGTSILNSLSRHTVIT